MTLLSSSLTAFYSFDLLWCAEKSAAMTQGTNRSQNQPKEDLNNQPQNEGVSRLKNGLKNRPKNLSKTGPKTGPETDPQIDPKAGPQELPAQALLTHLPFTTPKVLSDFNGRVFVSFYFHGKRHRFYSGAILGLAIRPNSNTCTDPLTTAQQLSAVFYGKLLSGWSPEKAGQKREEQRMKKKAERFEQREPKASPGQVCSAQPKPLLWGRRVVPCAGLLTRLRSQLYR